MSTKKKKNNNEKENKTWISNGQKSNIKIASNKYKKP